MNFAKAEHEWNNTVLSWYPISIKVLEPNSKRSSSIIINFAKAEDEWNSTVLLLSYSILYDSINSVLRSSIIIIIII